MYLETFSFTRLTNLAQHAPELTKYMMESGPTTRLNVVQTPGIYEPKFNALPVMCHSNNYDGLVEPPALAAGISRVWLVTSLVGSNAQLLLHWTWARQTI